jgi:ferredoxin--NADP+ reductase
VTTPEFPKVPLNLVRRSEPVTARVVSNELCMKGKSASFIKHLVLNISGTALENNFAAGQAFGVIVPGVTASGKPYKMRLYSIASPRWGEDGHGRLISTTPKRLIDENRPSKKDDDSPHNLFLGVCSNYLCDLQAGDEVALTGPSGHRFILPSHSARHDYVFLATGTGIAPFRGMLLELLTDTSRDPGASRIDLIMGAPYTTDLLYDDLLCDLAKQHANFHYHTAISREPAPGKNSGNYVDGIVEQQIEHFAPLLANERTLIYACGLEAMRYSLVRLLARHALGDAYFRLGDALDIANPNEWSDADIRRHVKPGERSFLEVY